MIIYNIQRDKNLKISIRGHANFGGSIDPICGMVSVLTQAALAGCLHYDGNTMFNIDEESGTLEFECKNHKISRGIVYAMEQGLMALEEQYPDYVKRGDS